MAFFLRMFCILTRLEVEFFKNYISIIDRQYCYSFKEVLVDVRCLLKVLLLISDISLCLFSLIFVVVVVVFQLSDLICVYILCFLCAFCCSYLLIIANGHGEKQMAGFIV